LGRQKGKDLVNLSLGTFFPGIVPQKNWFHFFFGEIGQLLGNPQKPTKRGDSRVLFVPLWVWFPGIDKDNLLLYECGIARNVVFLFRAFTV